MTEPCKIHIQKVNNAVQQHTPANTYLQKFLRNIRLKWKPSKWKWTVVSELQKNGIWHFHLLSTPIVPYSHRCTLDKNFTSCWNCRTYISELWPYGRVESRSPGYKTISSYLAKYLSKSFHLRSLYAKHGLKDRKRTYRFYLNLYDYDQKPALLISRHKLNAQTGQHLAPNQHVFRRYDYQTKQTSYFYRTNEKLIGTAAKPVFIKKNYRLGTRSLNPLNLLTLFSKSDKKEVYSARKPKQQLDQDFQTFLITRLLLLCKKAEFLHTPLEQEQVPKELNLCDQSIQNHFQTKPVLHFQFSPKSAAIVRTFIANLDTYSQEYDMEESKEFVSYPISHDYQHQSLLKLGNSCSCDPHKIRNQYLDNWNMNYANSDQWRRTPM